MRIADYANVDQRLAGPAWRTQPSGDRKTGGRDNVEGEAALLEELAQAVEWSGRYPVPKHSIDADMPNAVAQTLPKYEALARRLASLY